jgi:Nucleotidyl transferase AbiEii toxin, Type IV TA system
MPDRPRNIGASVRQRLLNLAHARGQPMELLLTRYALERLLHRLSLSPHRERFVLKGAMLLATWFDEPHRATRDVDLLGFGDAAEEALLATFREIMALEVDDGVSFDLKGLKIEAIREEVEYGGSRLRTRRRSPARAFRSPWTSASAMPSSPASRTSICRCCSTCHRLTFAPIHPRPSSPRSFMRWWSWDEPTAA